MALIFTATGWKRLLRPFPDDTAERAAIEARMAHHAARIGEAEGLQPSTPPGPPVWTGRPAEPSRPACSEG